MLYVYEKIVQVYFSCSKNTHNFLKSTVYQVMSRSHQSRSHRSRSHHIRNQQSRNNKSRIH
jgi:hypothetical protein